MTVTELLEHAQKLSPEERDELVQELIAMNTWTADDLEQLMSVEPLTGTWSDLEISDGAEWVNEQRRKRQARRQW